MHGTATCSVHRAADSRPREPSNAAYNRQLTTSNLQRAACSVQRAVQHTACNEKSLAGVNGSQWIDVRGTNGTSTVRLKATSLPMHGSVNALFHPPFLGARCSSRFVFLHLSGMPRGKEAGGRAGGGGGGLTAAACMLQRIRLFVCACVYARTYLRMRTDRREHRPSERGDELVLPAGPRPLPAHQSSDMGAQRRLATRRYPRRCGRRRHIRAYSFADVDGVLEGHVRDAAGLRAMPARVFRR